MKTVEEILDMGHKKYPVSIALDPDTGFLEDTNEPLRNAYMEGLAEVNQKSHLTGYIARDKDGELWLYISSIPPVKSEYGTWERDSGCSEFGLLKLDKKLCPEITWDDLEPVNVGLNINLL